MIETFLFISLVMLFSVDMITTFDLEHNHESFNIKNQFPDKSVRIHYFLATCLFLDADINLVFVLKTDRTVV